MGSFNFIKMSKEKCPDGCNGMKSTESLYDDAGVLCDTDLTDTVKSIREKAVYQLDYVKALAEMDYESNLDALRAFKFYDPDFYSGRDARHPSLHQVQTILARDLTPSQAEFVRMMKKPVFQIVPVTNYDRYTDVYTNHLGLSETGWVKRAWDNYDGNKSRNSWAPITGWEVAVSDDVDFPMKNDSLELSLKERVKWFEDEFGGQGVTGMDFRRYMMLAMMRMMPGVPPEARGVDSNTLLNGVPVFDDAVGVGTLNVEDGDIRFRDAGLDCALNNVVMKPSVVIPFKM